MKLIVFDELVSDVEETCDWIRSLGLDPKDIRPWGAIINHGDGWKLHVLRFRKDAEGKMVLSDVGPVDDIACDPIVVDLPGDNWPGWLNRVGPVEVPDAPGEAIVRTMWLAARARMVSQVRMHEAEARS